MRDYLVTLRPTGFTQTGATEPGIVTVDQVTAQLAEIEAEHREMASLRQQEAREHGWARGGVARARSPGAGTCHSTNPAASASPAA